MGNRVSWFGILLRFLLVWQAQDKNTTSFLKSTVQTLFAFLRFKKLFLGLYSSSVSNSVSGSGIVAEILQFESRAAAARGNVELAWL